MKKIYFASIVVCFFCFCKLQGQNLSLGLVACYPFNGNANDMSGNNHNGVVNGAALTSDRFGNPNSAYGFNGVSDLIALGLLSNILPSGNEISISVWEQPNILQLQTLLMVNPDDFNDRFNFMAYYSHNGSPYMFEDYGDCTFNGRLSYAMSSFSSGWEHYVYIVDYPQNYMAVYRNGTLLTSKNSASYLTNRIRYLNIGYGMDVNNALFYFNGKIDDIRIYNRDLSTAEIQMLYTQNISCSPTATFFPDKNSSVELMPSGRNKFLLLNHGFTKSLSLNVVNLTGQIVFEKNGIKKSNEINLDFSNCAKGIYMLRVFEDNVQIKTIKFSVN